MITGKNYIGTTLSGEGSITFSTFNPQTNSKNKEVFYEATSQEIEAAATLAAKAFTSYSRYSGKQRASFLNAIAQEIENLGSTLIDMYMAESGLPQGRAEGERGRTVGQLRMFAQRIEDDAWRMLAHDTALPDRKPIPKPDLKRVNIPIGPIVVFGASNFPLAYSTAGGDTASALAAGCPVIVKSHPMHAGTGELVAQAIAKAAKNTGMPEGVFSNLNSSGIAVGEQLVKHPLVKGVGFTGSIKGGRALYDIAAKRKEPIPVFAEMGSVNPVIFSEEALQNRGEALAKTYAQSIALGTGQFCTNPGLLLAIESDALTDFTNQLSAHLDNIAPQCMLHPQIEKNYTKNQLEVSGQEGVSVKTNTPTTITSNYAATKLVTVSGATFIENPRLQEEVFGPFSMVVACKSIAQLEQLITTLEGQLTGTIIAEPNEYNILQDVVFALQQRVGRIIFNGVPTGVEVCDAMTHGGPYPASTDSRFTAVGAHAIQRWVRPFSFQNFPKELLPQYMQ